MRRTTEQIIFGMAFTQSLDRHYSRGLHNHHANVYDHEKRMKMWEKDGRTIAYEDAKQYVIAYRMAKKEDKR